MANVPRPVLISAFGPASLAAIRSWGRRGFAVGMICTRTEKEVLPCSRYLTSFISLHPKELYTEEGLAKIDRFLTDFRATGIMAIHERISCWLNDSRSRLKSPAIVWAPPTAVIQTLLSKGEQLKVAREVGFDLLPTWLLDGNVGEIESIPREHFPLCLRPDGPSAVSPSFKVRLAQTAQDLALVLRQLTRIERPVLAQPFRNLPNLVVHGSRTVEGKTIGIQGFLVERKFEGVTLTIRPVSIPAGLERRCAEFADRFALTGCFHFEFLHDSAAGKDYFLEINSRLGGTTAKVYVCGYDEPLLALESYGVWSGANAAIRNSTAAGRHALLKYCLYTLTNRVTDLDYPIERSPARLIKTLYALVHCRDEILSCSDIRGSLAFYGSLVKWRLR